MQTNHVRWGKSRVVRYALQVQLHLVTAGNLVQWPFEERGKDGVAIHSQQFRLGLTIPDGTRIVIDRDGHVSLDDVEQPGGSASANGGGETQRITLAGKTSENGLVAEWVQDHEGDQGL